MQADAEGALDLLLQHRPSLKPERALSALRTSDSAVAIAYLEAALAAGAADAARFDQRLAELYLAQLLDRAAARETASARQVPHAAAAADEAAGAGTDAMPDKLLRLLQASEHIDAQSLQQQVQQHQHLHKQQQRTAGETGTDGERQVARVQAALHECLSEHEEAMGILVHRLHDAAQAEALADRLYTNLVRTLHELLRMLHAQAPRVLHKSLSCRAATFLLDTTVAICQLSQHDHVLHVCVVVARCAIQLVSALSTHVSCVCAEGGAQPWRVAPS